MAGDQPDELEEDTEGRSDFLIAVGVRLSAIIALSGVLGVTLWIAIVGFLSLQMATGLDAQKFLSDVAWDDLVCRASRTIVIGIWASVMLWFAIRWAATKEIKV